MDFSKFDKKIDADQLKKDVEEAKKNGTGAFKDVPKGKYMCKLEKLEMKLTKTDQMPMVSVMFRIIGDEEGDKCDFTKHCIFMNRKICGTKNDANMIASIVGWLETLEPAEDIDVVFETYSQFNEVIMDIEEDVSENLRYVVDYDPDAFNSISIDEVYE